VPIPFIAIAEAIACGAGVVGHSSGGLIFSGASGYIAGTFISTAALGQLLWSFAAVCAAALGWLVGIPALVIGGPGLFGSTLGATGLTGLLMKAGIISSTPIWVVLAILLLPLLALFGLWRWWRLVKRVSNAAPGAELMFSKSEARFVQRLLVWFLFFRRLFRGPASQS
jgi:hypothetical protein